MQQNKLILLLLFLLTINLNAKIAIDNTKESNLKKISKEDKYRKFSGKKDKTFFNHFQYNISNRGYFILSSDKKSFYSNEIFALHKIKQMDINSSKLIAKTNGKHDYIWALSAWNKYILTRQRDGKIGLFLSKDEKLISIRTKKLSTKSILKAIVKDSSRAFIIYEDGIMFEINKKLEILKNYRLNDVDEENAICFDREKNIVYFGTKSKQIKALDLTTNKILFTSKALLSKDDEYAKIYNLKLNKTKDKLIGGFDKNLGIFDIKTKKLNYFGTNSMRVNALDISPNYKYIISTGISGGLKIWDYDTLQIKKELVVKSFGLKQSLHSSIDTVKFLDDDEFLYASSLEDVQLAKISTNKIIRDYSEKKYGHWIKKLANDKLAIISRSGTIYNYNLKKQKFMDVDKVHLNNIKRVESDRKSRLLFSQTNGKFILLNINTKHWKDYGKSLREHYTAQFALHPTKDRFARLSSNGTMQIFDMKAGKETFKIKSELFDSSETFAFLDENIIIHSSGQSAYTKDGDYASLDKAKPYLQFVDIKNKKIYHKKDHIDVVNSFDLSKDKKYMITASADRTIKLWRLNLKHIQNSKVIDTAYGEDDEVYSAYFNDSETKVVSFGKSGTIFIRDVYLKKGRFGTKIKVLEGNLPKKYLQERRSFEEVISFEKNNNYSYGTFYDNDKKIILDDSFGNINFYDIKSGKVLYRIVLFEQRDWLKIFPNGTYESSKNGYKYLKNQTYDIDIKDKIVLYNKQFDSEKVDKIYKKDKEKNDFNIVYIVLAGGLISLTIFGIDRWIDFKREITNG